MKAAVLHQYSGKTTAFDIVDIPKPVINDNEILIKNSAASINFIDTLKRNGYGKSLYERKRKPRFPYVLGCDGAGIIESVGKNMVDYKPGDAVYYVSTGFAQGTYAEFTKVPAHQVSIKPTNIDFTEAAALPYVACGIWCAFQKAKLTEQNAPYKKVLVHAGSGGVGTLAIQWLKAWGAYVATTTSTHNVAWVKALGADVVIDYTRDDFSKILTDFDVVLDTLNDHASTDMESKSISVLKQNKKSCYVTLVHPIIRNFDRHGFFFGLIINVIQGYRKSLRFKPISYRRSLYKPSSQALSIVKSLIEAGLIKPVINSVFPIEAVSSAHALMETRRTKGKMVLEIQSLTNPKKYVLR